MQDNGVDSSLRGPPDQILALVLWACLGHTVFFQPEPNASVNLKEFAGLGKSKKSNNRNRASPSADHQHKEMSHNPLLILAGEKSCKPRRSSLRFREASMEPV
jgi:hypothetical protein